MKTWSMFSTAFAVMLLSSCGGANCTSCLEVTVSGLVGSRLTLENNDVAPGRTIAAGANGIYPVFFGSLASGATYNITVTTQPTTPSQTCVVANGTGVIGAGRSDVSVTCTTRPGRFLYTTNALNPSNICSAVVSAYAIDSNTGALTSVNGSPFAVQGRQRNPGVCGMAGVSEPGAPTAITVDPSGRFVYVAMANAQVNSSVAYFTIDAMSGVLTSGSPVFAFEGPKSVAVDPSGQFLYAATDADVVDSYGITAETGELTSTGYFGPFPSQSSVSVDPLGRFAYVTGGGVYAFDIDNASGELTAVTGSPFAAGLGPAAVVIDPSGSYAYVANVDSSDISGYAIDPDSGALMPLAGSPFVTPHAPSALAIDPLGKFLYATNPLSNTLSIYRIDAWSGALRRVGLAVAAGSAPSAVIVDPTGRFVYVANQISNDISVYRIDPVSGGLTAISGSPFPGGGVDGAGPLGVAISTIENSLIP